MTELQALEKVFAHEIDGALSGSKIGHIFQSKAKIFKRLEEKGYLKEVSLIIPGPLEVVIRGFNLTEAGRLRYCLSCEGEVEGE